MAPRVLMTRPGARGEPPAAAKRTGGPRSAGLEWSDRCEKVRGTRRKRPNHYAVQTRLPFADAPDTAGTSVSGAGPLVIGGHLGPACRYFHFDAGGNLILWESFDPADPWWGVRLEGQPDYPVIVRRTEVMLRIFGIIVKVAPLHLPALIYGETGAGKELIAAALSAGHGGPFEIVNCALPDGGVSFEDRMLGRIDRVIEGAPAAPGPFEAADNGTLLLDNVDCLSWEQQGKLLRVTQSYPQRVRRIGWSSDKTVRVRLLAAANRALSSLVERGEFRRDLYGRLRNIPIDLPPLRDRKEDIPLLTAYLLHKHRGLFPRTINTVDHEAVARLRPHSWPLNVRELEGEIERVLALGEEAVLRPEELGLASGQLSVVSTPHLPGPLSTQSSGRNQTRSRGLRIVQLLREKPGSTARGLATELSVSPRTILRSLRPLLGKRVESRRDGLDGRDVRYYLSGEPSALP